MISGWLVLDKPLDISSAKFLNKIKYLLSQAVGSKYKIKIGHAGTLDPKATGVLPIAVGEATKVINYITEKEKEYSFTICFGEERSTGDAEGEVISTHDKVPHSEEIQQIIPKFLGEIEQKPHKYSAVKVHGKRAYNLARQGIEFDLQSKKINIYSLNLLEIINNQASFTVICSPGTYIRSLASDMANALGTLGYISYLRRTRVGIFDKKYLISLDKLEKMLHNADVKNILLPVSQVLDDIPVLEVGDDMVEKIKQGQSIAYNEEDYLNNKIVQLTNKNNHLIALCSFDKGQIVPKRVFNIMED